MGLDSIILVAGDTARSRCYLQALAAIGLPPSRCVLLPSPAGGRPGQISRNQGVLAGASGSWGHFDPNIELVKTCQQVDVRVTLAPQGDINHPEVVAQLHDLDASAFLYSGYGGTILRRDTLQCGKPFLHIHGGWLPDYKGSTTNHYSILEAGFCGASAIFLSDTIDSGTLLWRSKFPAPEDPRDLDLILDSIYRAEVLCDVMRYYIKHNVWPNSCVTNESTEPYYIMHPVLRHILMLGGRLDPS